jgi:hypothetical protein
MWIVWMKVKFVNEIIKKLVEVDNMDWLIKSYHVDDI